MKEEKARELLDALYSRMDENGGLNQWEQAMFDVLSWWLEDADEPSID